MEIIERDNGYVLLRVGPEREMYDAGQAGGRLLEEAVRTGAAMVYCDYWLRAADGKRKDNPVNDYQPGSVREDFDFGALVAVNEDLMEKWEQETAEGNAEGGTVLKYGRWYEEPGGADRDGGYFYGSSKENRGVAAAADADCGGG